MWMSIRTWCSSASAQSVLAIPLGFLGFSGEVRWSANRAFLIAAIGYAVMIRCSFARRSMAMNLITC